MFHGDGDSTKMINGIVCNEAKAKLLYHLARLPISCMSVMIVRDVMNRKIVSIDSEKPVIEVVKLMVAKDIGSIAVMAGKKYVGIVTERDILKKVTLQSSDARRVKVDEIMSSPLITIQASQTVGQAAQLMVERKIRRLFAVDDGKIIGIFTQRDLQRATAGLERNLL